MMGVGKSAVIRASIGLGCVMLIVGSLAACVAETTGAKAPASGAAASAQRGLLYAQRRCATCHAIAAGEVRSPAANAPSFDVVANTPGMTPTALNAWLHSPHQTMPQLIVPSSDLDDISAYLETLARHGGRA